MDDATAILLELNIMFAIPLIFDHLGPNCSPVAMSVQNTPPQEKTRRLGGRSWVFGCWCCLRVYVWVVAGVAVTCVLVFGFWGFRWAALWFPTSVGVRLLSVCGLAVSVVRLSRCQRGLGGRGRGGQCSVTSGLWLLKYWLSSYNLVPMPLVALQHSAHTLPPGSS